MYWREVVLLYYKESEGVLISGVLNSGGSISWLPLNGFTVTILPEVQL